MRRWTLAAAAAALLGAALWHLPATAQRTAPPPDNPALAAPQAAPAKPSAVAPPAMQPPAIQPPAIQTAARPVPTQLITFVEYRDFRMRDIAQRQARLARSLASPDLSATDKASLERRKAYYDRLAAMPEDQRNQLFRVRFDQIDTDHDGMLDDAERAAWREKQREHFRELTAAHAVADPDQH
jgi:hypothetical protein